MDVDQEHTSDLSPTNCSLSHDAPAPSHFQAQEAFPLMLLPLELRRKIYCYLLPPQTHTITTHFPTSGYFYNTSNIAPSSQSTFPFGQLPEKHHTSYIVSSASTSKLDPALKPYPEILRVSRRVHQETEEILYGAKGVIFDFGIHVNVISSFLADRSERARQNVKEIRLAREMPRAQHPSTPQNELWYTVCSDLRAVLKNLKCLNLVLWSDTGSSSHFPCVTASTESASQQWAAWYYTRTLLDIGSLRSAIITIWNFPHVGVETLSWSPGGREGFDGWLARKMVDDCYLKERMITEGVLEEKTVVFNGLWEN